MTTKIFGTDGIRGTANIYPMTSEVALALGRAVAHKARKRSARPKIIVGKDTRLSCYMIEMAIVSGICSMGADALMTGPIPTPGIAHLTKDMRCDAGIMITASHNPFKDNGMKVFGPDGFKLSDEEELELETYIRKHYTTDQLISTDDDSYPKEERIGKAFKIEDARGRYIAHLKSVFPEDLDLCGMKIALDCANGAAYKVAPAVFRELGAEVLVIGDEPNGTNINELCGALNPNALSNYVMLHNCDVGIALDGDADRLVVIDEKGGIVDGDAVLALAIAARMKEGPKLWDNGLVVTTMSNMALHEFMKNYGSLHVTDVGDKNVIDKMREEGIWIGGEKSGHIIYLEHATTGDGILAALKMLGYIRQWKKTISENGLFAKYDGPVSKYMEIIKPYPQVLINIDVKEKIPIADIPGLQNKIDDVYNSMNGEGRVIVRYSGTENKLRIMVEYKDEQTAYSNAEEIEKHAKKYLF